MTVGLRRVRFWALAPYWIKTWKTVIHKTPFLFVLLIALVSTPAAAIDIVVTNDSNSGPGSLRQAIIDANANTSTQPIRIGLYLFNAARIELASPLPVITRHDVTVMGPPTDPTTLDGGDSHTIFRFQNNGTSDGKLENLRLVGGHATAAAGVGGCLGVDFASDTLPRAA